MSSLVKVTAIYRSGSAAKVLRDHDGVVTLSVENSRGPALFYFTSAEWADFLRACNADAAQHHWEIGPYQPPKEPATA